MAEIRWTSEAETWLRDIHDYIANDNPHAAMRVAQAIYEKVQTLREFPDTGYIYRSENEG
jgi:plasmid stabilization system protein ParE